MGWVTQRGMVVTIELVKLPVMGAEMSWEMLNVRVDFQIWSSNVQDHAGLE
jgi:hypothetical protein